MKNDLLSIAERTHYWINQMLHSGVNPEFMEMDALNIITDELLVSMGYDATSYDKTNDPIVEELKKALINMFFLGKITGKEEQKHP